MQVCRKIYLPNRNSLAGNILVNILVGNIKCNQF